MMDYAVQKAEEIRGKIASGDEGRLLTEEGRRRRVIIADIGIFVGLTVSLEGYQYSKLNP